MKLVWRPKLGLALVVGVAISAVVISQITFAQVRGDRAVQRLDDNSEGIARLIGTTPISPGDPRFQPAALMIINEAGSGDARAGKPHTYIDRTIYTDVFKKNVIIWLRIVGEEPGNFRPLTPMEQIVMVELFSGGGIGRDARVQVTPTGITGTLTPQDIGMTPEELTQRAWDRAERMEDRLEEAARGLARSPR